MLYKSHWRQIMIVVSPHHLKEFYHNLIAPPQPVSLSGIMYDHDIQMLVNTERGVLGRGRGCGMYLETGKSRIRLSSSTSCVAVVPHSITYAVNIVRSVKFHFHPR